MRPKVAVMGAGAWGSALCFPLCENDSEVWLWGRSSPSFERLRDTRENAQYLSGVRLPASLRISDHAAECIEDADIVFLSVPTHAYRAVLRSTRAFVGEKAIVVSVAKGIEPQSLLRMSEVIAQELPNHARERIACISGPNFAVEVAARQPSATVVGASGIDAARKVQDVLMTPDFRVYTNPDIAGVELGGSLKNIVALGVGIAEGMGLGYNARAALITRGLAEMARLGRLLGANPLTFAGLSGMGDLVLTCTGEHSRNRKCGLALGEGERLADFLRRTGSTVEGVRTAEAAHQLSLKHGVELPVSRQIYEVLFLDKEPQAAVRALMARGKRHEIEEVASPHPY